MREGPGHVTSAEWRWALSLGLIVIAATCIPYLVAELSESPQQLFSGCVVLIEDCYSYLGKMRQGAEGAWLFHISYVPEEHPGTLFFPFHLILGKVAKLLPGPDLTAKTVLVYHAARVVCGLGFLLIVYRFLAAFTARVRVRRVAWLMVALGGGLGWLVELAGRRDWLGGVPLDLYFPEGFALIALWGFPHVAAAQSLLLLGFLSLLRAWHGGTARRDGQKVRRVGSGLPSGLRPETNEFSSRGPGPARWAALAGLTWLLMGLIVPFYVAVAWAVTGALWVTLCVRGGGATWVRWREAGLTAVTAVVSAPVVIYALLVFAGHPVYETWAAQNQIQSPGPLHLLVVYGPLAILAAFAVREAWEDDGAGWVALSWVVAVPVLISLPVNLQLRLATGAQVPLSLLSAKGATRLWHGGRRWLVLSLLIPIVPSSLFILGGSSAWLSGRPSPPFHDAAEVAAMDWLAGHAERGDAVVSAYHTGTYLPARADVRTLVGHDLEALHAEQRKEQVRRFFDLAASHAWRRQFLSQHGIDYVLWGPREKALGCFDPDASGYLRPVYEAGGYVIFAVKP